jgi:hypothetical protein
MKEYIKDPDATLDYADDWTAWLGDDTIQDSQWIITPTGALEAADDTNTDTVTTVWLTGGDRNVTYLVTNHITTAGGRIDDRTFKILVTDR